MDTIQAPAPAPAELAPPTSPVDISFEFGDFKPEVEIEPEVTDERAKILGSPEVAEEVEVSYVEEVTAPDPETEVSNLSFGHLLLSENKSYLNIGNYGLVTSIAPEYFTLPEGLKGSYVTLPVDTFDQLPLGDYTIGASDGRLIEESTVRVHETDNGRVFERVDMNTKLNLDTPGFVQASDSLRGKRKPMVAMERGVEAMANPNTSITTKDRWYLSVLKKLGAVTKINEYAGSSSEVIVGLPTPNTLSKKLNEMGLKHKFISKATAKGFTPVKDYVRAFSESSYPIGISNLEEYKHDIQDDHLSGILCAGGQRVLEALQPFALSAIESGDEQKIIDTGETIDKITFAIRTIFINSSNNWFGERIDGELENLITGLANSLGIEYSAGSFSAGILDGILSTGREQGWSEATLQNGQKRITELKQPVLANA